MFEMFWMFWSTCCRLFAEDLRQMESAFFISKRGNVRKEIVSSWYLHSSTLTFWSSLVLF